MRVLLMFCLLATAASAQTTDPVERMKYSPEYIKRIQMSSEIPVPIDRFDYQVTGTFNGDTYHESVVPIYRISGGLVQVDELSIGSQVTLDYVQLIAGRNFFGFDRKVKLGEQEIDLVVWIDGKFVKIVGQ